MRIPRNEAVSIDVALRSAAAPADALAHACRCGSRLCSTCSDPVLWCAACRSAYFADTRHFLCEVPRRWQHDRYFAFWRRGLARRRALPADMLFTAFFTDRCRLDPDALTIARQTPQADDIRIGRLALEHRLMSRQEVAWILKYQRGMRAHKRRCFGDIAVGLGILHPGALARILAALAERRRGVVPMLVRLAGIDHARVLLAESAFFGLECEATTDRLDAPLDAAMFNAGAT
jgi:hypothetical protein